MLATEEYGIVDLFITLTPLVIPLVTFQIEQSVLRELISNREDEKEKTTIITTCIIFSFIQVVVVSALFLLISPIINTPYKFYLLGYIIVSIFSVSLLQISRGLGDNKNYTIGSFINAISILRLKMFMMILSVSV